MNKLNILHKLSKCHLDRGRGKKSKQYRTEQSLPLSVYPPLGIESSSQASSSTSKQKSKSEAKADKTQKTAKKVLEQ